MQATDAANSTKTSQTDCGGRRGGYRPTVPGSQYGPLLEPEEVPVPKSVSDKSTEVKTIINLNEHVDMLETIFLKKKGK